MYATYDQLFLFNWAFEYHNSAPDDVYASWSYLATHPLVCDALGTSYLSECLGIDMHLVDPVTGLLRDSHEEGAELLLSLSLRPLWRVGDMRDGTALLHDEPATSIFLTVDAPSFEQAVLLLAQDVAYHFGDDRQRLNTEEIPALCPGV